VSCKLEASAAVKAAAPLSAFATLATSAPAFAAQVRALQQRLCCPLLLRTCFFVKIIGRPRER
jgi:hypothetical protein